MKKTALASSILFALPFVAFAQTLTPLVVLVQSVGVIVNLLIPIMIAAAIVVFFFGLIKYIFGAGKGHAMGQKMMVAGILSLFVMVSIWGIIQFAQGALGINGNINTLTTPHVQQY